MPKKPRRRAQPAPVIPGPERLGELYAELMGLPNVEGCYVGFKRRDGRMVREVSIIACVSAKPTTRAIPRDGRVPKRLGWRRTSRRSGSIRTDVQVLGQTAFSAAVLGAGDGIDQVTVPGAGPHSTAGTVGAAMRHPLFGKVVTTAGHVLGLTSPTTVSFPSGAEPRVLLRNGGNGVAIEGIARKASITDDADYALISPPAGMAAENLYQDQEHIALPLVPGPEDLNTPVFILARPKIFATRLLGIHGAMVVDGLALRDLLLTPLRSNGGDSGACLINSDSRLLGFVEGGTRLDGRLVTVYTSAAWPFVREQGVFF
ncbi:MAG TPA: hypothetical protein VFU23_02215 [Gemmatimonadales bacterium]|nr:hypothetical protein [Gemmatimonadales bacterium]